MNAVASRNVKFISHSDQGGRGDGVQIMVHRGYAYIGHGYSNGISVLDVRDPKNPRPVAFLPCPPDTRAIHLQTHDDLLLAVNGPSMWTMQVDAQAYYSGSPADLLKGQQYSAGVRVFDIAHPEAPREIAFMATEGVGPHRIWYVGGRYAYVSIHYPEFTDQVLAIVDMADPTRPEVVGKWWIPGMWTGGGETPSWPKGRRYALHHALVAEASWGRSTPRKLTKFRVPSQNAPAFRFPVASEKLRTVPMNTARRPMRSANRPQMAAP